MVYALIQIVVRERATTHEKNKDHSKQTAASYFTVVIDFISEPNSTLKSRKKRNNIVIFNSFSVYTAYNSRKKVKLSFYRHKNFLVRLSHK